VQVEYLAESLQNLHRTIMIAIAGPDHRSSTSPENGGTVEVEVARRHGGYG
jgi:hypothetical protein